MNDPRGSLWWKWDLHVHTPSSIVNEYGGEADDIWERFLKDLESLPSQFKVIGINDYIFLDGYKRVCQEKQRGRLNNIDLILPVIELRLDKFGGTEGSLSRVNFHVIFSNELDPETIQEQFLSAIRTDYKLTPENEERKIEWNAIPTKRSIEDLGRKIIESVPIEKRNQYGSPLKEGFYNINFSYDKVKDALNSSYLKGKYITAVGKTEWANIKWNDQSIAEKKSIINNAGFVFISAESVDACHKSKKSLSDAKVNDRLLDCSDAHTFSNSPCKDRIGNCFTWIKADPTFEGLKHVLNEPHERIFIGDIPEKLKVVLNNKTKYIKSLRIYKKTDSKLDEIWFDNCQLLFNPGIVAIIGNKGMGKSALSDILALLCNCSCSDYSFLNEEKFRERKNNKSSSFEAQIEWESCSDPFARNLATDVSPHEVEQAKYIPQKYFEKICNENALGEGSIFDRELKKVIFSHVDIPDRLSRASLDDLLDYKTSEIKDRISSQRLEMNQINEKIAKLEESVSDGYRLELKNKILSKEHELESFYQSKPKEIAKPSSSIEIDKKINNLRNEIKQISLSIFEYDKQLNDIKIKLASLEKVKSKIENLKQIYEKAKNDSLVEFEHIGAKFENIIQLKISLDILSNLSAEFQKENSDLEEYLSIENPNSLKKRKGNLEEELKAIQSQLDESEKDYHRYQDDSAQWDIKKEEIIGNAEKIDSLEYYKNMLKISNEIEPIKLKSAKEKRNEVVREIYGQLKQIANIYEESYKPVQKFIDGHELIKNKYKLNFNVSIVEMSFIKGFFKYINQSKKGTFNGTQEGQERLMKMLDSYNFDKQSDILSFLDDLIISLEKDKRDPKDAPVRLENQLRKGIKKNELYDFIFSLEYIEPKYILRLGGKELLQLSPGERGVLLLIFYLLVDKDDCPLIIDQPEDNLDNQSVFELVAPCIRESRLRRQLFIVTHNPNLAVVCDAEQVITASIDKANKERVTYISGAIENPLINRRIIDILEGTKPAFRKRESKYFLFASDEHGRSN